MNQDPSALNRAFWDAVTPVHVNSAFYDVDGFLAGRSTLNAIEIAGLGEVTGRRVMHLQCHFGLDTLSVARLGAEVVGVDLSAVAIAAARDLAKRAGLDRKARFVESDALSLDLGERFDVVLVNVGAIVWLHSLDRWAEVIAAHLEPDGHVIVVECHPFAMTLEETAAGLVVRHSYYGDGQPIVSGPCPDYADPSYVFPGGTREYLWSLAQVKGALFRAGLRVQQFDEYPYTVYKMFPSMSKRDDGFYHPPGSWPKLPLLMSIRARRAVYHSAASTGISAVDEVH